MTASPDQPARPGYRAQLVLPGATGPQGPIGLVSAPGAAGGIGPTGATGPPGTGVADLQRVIAGLEARVLGLEGRAENPS
jgi:hypothetical protein